MMIQRYGLNTLYERIDEYSDGEYVKYEDVENLLINNQRAVEAMANILEAFDIHDYGYDLLEIILRIVQKYEEEAK